jgi:hypothetical protein
MKSQSKLYDELNYNSIVAEFMSAKFDDLLNASFDKLTDVTDTVRAKLKRGYKKYLEKMLIRYGKSRSFFIRDEPKDLYSFYVPVGLMKDDIKIPSANLRTILSVNSNTAIC